MFLDPFHQAAGPHIRISADQASRFAKQVAGDFNPIHDADSRRFCVPGDLLFALALQRYGLSQRMSFRFTGMVDADEALLFPQTDATTIAVTTAAGREVLTLTREGARRSEPTLLEAMTRHYVAFSGENFPHVLQPLLAQHGVMFNPERPLVIYDSMDFSLDSLDLPGPASSLRMQLENSRLDVQGKRGDVWLDFAIHCDGEVIGRGSKKLLVSNLRAYDETRMQQIIVEFNRRKAMALEALEA